MAEQIKERAQKKAYDAFQYAINNDPYAAYGLSGAVVGRAVDAAYNSYVDVLLDVYRD